MYYVYVIRSEKRKLCYIGSTSNIKARFENHNRGLSTFTKSGIPWILAYYEAFRYKKVALIEEKFLKTGAGRERLKKILPEYYLDLL